MTVLTHKRAWLAAAAAVALALPLTAAHGALAQTATQTNTSCPPTTSQTLSPDQLQTQVQQEQTTFAQDLAQALNLSPSAVQQAISTVSTNDQSSVTLPTPPPNPIAAAAQQLGVTEDQLATAIRAGDATLPCSFGPPPSAGSAQAGFFISTGGPNTSNSGPAIDTSSFFASVAQSLGGSFTGQQVQAAFQATAPALPDPSQLQSRIQSQLSNLASALGVSNSTLTAALQTLGTSGACLPPGVLGDEVTVRTGGPVTPPSFGDGPIFIPLGMTNGQSGPPAILAQLGIKPCGPVVFRDGGAG